MENRGGRKLELKTVDHIGIVVKNYDVEPMMSYSMAPVYPRH